MSLLITTNIIGKPDVPSYSQLHVMAEVMGWAEAVALGCLTALSCLCQTLEKPDPCVTCLEFSRNRAVYAAINKLVLASYEKYIMVGESKLQEPQSGQPKIVPT